MRFKLQRARTRLSAAAGRFLSLASAVCIVKGLGSWERVNRDAK